MIGVISVRYYTFSLRGVHTYGMEFLIVLFLVLLNIVNSYPNCLGLSLETCQTVPGCRYYRENGTQYGCREAPCGGFSTESYCNYLATCVWNVNLQQCEYKACHENEMQTTCPVLACEWTGNSCEEIACELLLEASMCAARKCQWSTSRQECFKPCMLRVPTQCPDELCRLVEGNCFDNVTATIRWGYGFLLRVRYTLQYPNYSSRVDRSSVGGQHYWSKCILWWSRAHCAWKAWNNKMFLWIWGSTMSCSM